MADVDDLLAAITNKRPLKRRLPPVDKRPQVDPYKGLPAKKRKKRIRPRPRKAWQRKPARLYAADRDRWRLKWENLERIERRLPARKDRLIAAMIAEGLTWEHVIIVTGVSKSYVARAMRNVRDGQPGKRGPTPRGKWARPKANQTP
jgi:hypothetical protein